MMGTESRWSGLARCVVRAAALASLGGVAGLQQYHSAKRAPPGAWRAPQASPESEEQVRADFDRRLAEDARVTLVDDKGAAPLQLTPVEELALPLLVAEKALVAVEGLVEWRRGAVMKKPKKAAASSSSSKEHVVVLGSGWAAAALVSSLGDDFEVTVISPRNYFLFTPMLAGSAVGTVEFRSICEPLRALSDRVDYLEAAATAIDIAGKRVICDAVLCEGAVCSIDDFAVSYDKLVVTVGATTNTFGVKGVADYCLFLREISDAAALRQSIGNCFERANLPTLSDDERRRAVSFVVVGAGPTGVEFCAELRDFLSSEATRFYPRLLDLVSVTLLEATGSVLGAFDVGLRDVALERLQTRLSSKVDGSRTVAPVNVRLGAAVSEVTDTMVLVGDEAIPYGVCVWATGNGASRLVTETIAALPAQAAYQAATRGRLATDEFMRVLGTAPGTVFALGDCAAYAARPLPPTAQVAAQQGEYLARLLERYDVTADRPARALAQASAAEQAFCTKDHQGGGGGGDDDPLVVLARPFQFLNLGILAYVGDERALAQVGKGKGLAITGKFGYAIWRSVYLAKQLSSRNRLLLLGDWARTQLFGRDLTRF